MDDKAAEKATAKENQKWKKVTRVQIERLASLMEGQGDCQTFKSVLKFHTNFRDRGEALEFKVLMLKTLQGREVLLRGFIFLNEDSMEILDGA